ncbi:MAG: HAD family hydrolase [Tannerella sp.]|jgi:putative hydrolase of the HAD superfamily|nr:HAD family hydrolase [Tannerella sp.]
MIVAKHIRGILFDYGGTIDSNGVHWAEVMWQAYSAENVPVTKEVFREAYIHGERTLATKPLVRPDHTFLDMLLLKTDIQLKWLKTKGRLPAGARLSGWKYHIAAACYAYAKRTTAGTRPVLSALARKYPLALVSNFYGNIASVLEDFYIGIYFSGIIESSVVGVRKPDPQIFRLGVKMLGLQADEVAVVGDSYEKDILPSATIGCHTVWLKKTGWNAFSGDETADAVISDFAELKQVFGVDGH